MFLKFPSNIYSFTNLYKSYRFLSFYTAFKKLFFKITTIHGTLKGVVQPPELFWYLVMSSLCQINFKTIYHGNRSNHQRGFK